ncbi:MAG: N-acyl homoserine lactonase family protein [Thermodesulfobacteriota bacterium]
MAKLKIHVLSSGRFMSAEKSNFTYQMDQGVKIVSPILMYFIEGAGSKILVDTGVSDPEWAAKYHHPIKRRPEEEPLTALRGLGVEPQDLDLIINTHLHWDHCFNNHLFSRARILVQEAELRYAIAPLACQALFYESAAVGLTPSWLKSLERIQPVRGEYKVEEGISLVPLPGHTLGCQGVLVQLASGPCLLAGDNCPLLENWEGNQLQKHIPPGIHVNLTDCYDSFARMEQITDRILPGHDLKALAMKQVS